MKRLAERMPGSPIHWISIGGAQLLLGAVELFRIFLPAAR